MSQNRSDWEAAVLGPATQRSNERKSKFITESDIETQTVYTPEDSPNFKYQEKLGYPGEYPFTRGVQPNMYRGRLWTMRQYSGYASAAETNQRFRYLLDQGQTGLSVAFDLPTQNGFDSDHDLAKGEVGKVGVPIDTLDDMETLFDKIPLDKVTTSMTINATASILLAMYLSVAKKQDIPFQSVGGTLQNDILKEYIARGTYIYPPTPSLRLITDVFEYCSEHVPQWNTISISGYHMREAGANAVQELAFTFTNAIAYIEAALDTGLTIDSFAPRLSFFFVAHNNLFEEVAKYRAARRIWARIMKDRFNAENPRSMMLRFHTQTAGVTLTAQQPDNNVVRTTIQALAGILGGTQSLHVNSKDEALALPSEESVLLSLRTQQILAHESGVADTVDPLAGSYYVESLTDEIEQAAEGLIETILSAGGALQGLENGLQVQAINESAWLHQKAVETGDRIVVGVNQFQSDSAQIGNLLKIHAEEQATQIAKLERIKIERDNTQVLATLRQLHEVASGTSNTVPALIACAEAYASLGEMCDVLRDVFGEQQQYSFF